MADSRKVDLPRKLGETLGYDDQAAPDTASIAGSLGLGLLSLSILKSVDALAEQVAQYRKASENPTPLTRVTNKRAAAYTLVHCAETLEQAEKNRIWDSVWWWYKNLAEFTIEWELPNMPQEEVDRIFPFIEQQAEGGVPVEKFDAECGFPTVVEGLRQGLTGGCRQAEGRQVLIANLGIGEHLIDRGRNIDQNRGVISLDSIE